MAPIATSKIIHCTFNAHTSKHSSAPSKYIVEATQSLYQSMTIEPPLPAGQKPNQYVSNVLDPLFQKTTSINVISEDRAKLMWRSYLMLCQSYAQEVLMKYRPGDLVWIHDYRLLMLPHFLRKIKPGINIGLSIYAKFPNWEQFAGVHGNTQLLKSMLQADRIGFESKAESLQFTAVCQKMLQSTSSAPEQISIPTKQQICECCAYRRGQQNPKVLKRAKQLRSMFPHKQIILSRSSSLANIFRTLAAFADLLLHNAFMVERAVLFMFCAPSVSAKDLKSVHEIARQINQIYGNTEFVPVHLYHQEIDSIEEEAFMTASDLGVFLDKNEDDDIIQFALSQRRRCSPVIVHSSSSLARASSDCDGIVTVIEHTHIVSNISSALYENLTSCTINVKAKYEALCQSILKDEATSIVDSFIPALNGSTASEKIPLTNTPKPLASLVTAYPAGQDLSSTTSVTQQDTLTATTQMEVFGNCSDASKPCSTTMSTTTTVNQSPPPSKDFMSTIPVSKQPCIMEVSVRTLPSEITIPTLTTSTTASECKKTEKPSILNRASGSGVKVEIKIPPNSCFSTQTSNLQESEEGKLPTLSFKLKAHTALTDWHSKYLKKVSLLKVLTEYPSPIT